ncbi:MAG: hypothetical protein WDW36_001009 [Sanguina aurantia]
MAQQRMDKPYLELSYQQLLGVDAAVAAMVATFVPKDEEVIIGCGDWNGGYTTGFSGNRLAFERFKERLKVLPNVTYLVIGEGFTSRTCSSCWYPLSNAVAPTTTIPKSDTSLRVVHTGPVWKLMQCKDRPGEENDGRCGRSWDRDVNVSINMMMLMQYMIAGAARPAAFVHGADSRKL